MIGLENPLHIAMILVVLLLVFGAKRLPEMGKSLGEGLRGFKQSLTSETRRPSSTADAHPRRGAQQGRVALVGFVKRLLRDRERGVGGRHAGVDGGVQEHLADLAPPTARCAARRARAGRSRSRARARSAPRA